MEPSGAQFFIWEEAYSLILYSIAHTASSLSKRQDYGVDAYQSNILSCLISDCRRTLILLLSSATGN